MLAPHWFGEKAEKLPVPPGRHDAGVGERVVVRTHAHFAEAAGEIDPGFVDLVAVVVFAFELDARADLEAVVENGRTGEVDFGVAEHAVGVALVAGLAFAVVVEVDHVGGLEETADTELDPIGRERRTGHQASTEQGRGTQENFLHLEIP